MNPKLFYQQKLLSQKSLLNLGEEICGSILRGEKCWFLFGLPQSGRSSAVRQIIYHPEIISKEWENKLTQNLWGIVDLPAEKTPLDYLLESPYFSEKFNSANLPSKEFSKIIGWLVTKKDQKITFVVNSLDSMNNKKRQFIWRRLLDAYYLFPNSISFLLGQGWEEVNKIESVLEAFSPYYLTNRSWFKLRNQEDIKQFLLNYQETTDQELKKEDFEKFTYFSGGFLPLMQRFLEKPELLESEKIALNDAAIGYALDTLWDSCSEKSQEQLLNFAKSKKEKTYSDYLLKTGVLKRQNNELLFFSPLFYEWVKRALGKKEIKITSQGGILWLNEKLDLKKELSDQEYDVLKLLWDKRRKLVSREQVAQTMWPKAPEESYSDWAIDQVIYQIRKKIGDIGKERKLKTAKRKGFILNL